MRLHLTVPNPATTNRAESHNVVLDVEETATIAEVAEALRIAPDALAAGVDTETELADAGIVNGTVLPRTAPLRLEAGTMRLEFVGGPFSGEVVALSSGATITVGQDPSMLLRLLDPAIAPHHATILVARADGQDATPSHRATPSAVSMTLTPASDTAPVLLNGARVAQATVLGPNDFVQLGASILRIGRTPGPDADVQRDGLSIAFNRSSRIRPPQTTPVVKLPGEKPTAAERAPMPWLSALIPVVIGVTLAIIMQRPYMLLMAAASPLMVIGSYLTSRQLAKRTGKRTVDTWRNEVATTRSTIDGLIENQRNRSWRTSLDPVAVADLAVAPLGRLWERRVSDDDALRVRVGVGDVDLDVRFEGARPRHAGEEIRLGVSPTPVSVDLSAGVVGIAGVRAVSLGVARSMVMSLATTRSPRDLDLVLFCEDTAADDWSWWRWLPHADGGAAALALVGNTADARLARLRELTALLEARQAARGASARMLFDHHTVVLLDGARSLRTLPGMVALLEHGPAHGIYLVAVEDDRARLPQECATEVLINDLDVSMGAIESSVDPCARVLLDGTTVAAAEEIARALAPIVHVGGAGDDTALPRSVRFVELAGLDLEDPAPLVSRWLFRPRETRALVGAGPDGEFAIDLAVDGPHGLVAGTTGAGKSEFLQTLVVSLALANRPDALTFVLVDYKGGSAFADCERLPHTIGLVTNLDGRETERALESLDAELKRRERVLKDLGAKDADTAWEKAPEQAAARGLARLVLVIDEFAELKAELPDFITGLVRIARVGRSLGVHLILATQRPSGSITPEMQSNTNLRVALRVTDKGDSSDILGSPEAAAISTTTPGRGYVRRGPGTAPAAFQTARVAGRRPGVQHTHRTLPRTIARPWRDIGAPVMFPKAAASETAIDHDDTDLRAIVNVITDASTQLGVTKNPSPWLPPLPTLVTLDDIAPPSAPEAIILGLEDVPGEQAQRPLEWNVVTDSHLLIAGGARSGATSMLRTMAAQLVERFSADDLHLYAIDYGTSALLPLADVPHCGAVITASEGSRLQRFITRIHEEISRRGQILAAGRFGSIQEQRAATATADRMAYAVILIDGWDRLLADHADSLIAFREHFIKILREGPAVGIRMVISGDRGVVPDKIGNFIATKYALPLPNRDDYGFINAAAKQLPTTIEPGRIFFGGPHLREAQLAVLPGGASGEHQAEEFTKRIDQVRAANPVAAGAGARRPLRVDTLPSFITLSDTTRLRGEHDEPEHAVTIAVGGDDLQRITVDGFTLPGFIIIGDRRTGRSTALATIATQLAAMSDTIIVVSLNDSPLRRAATELGLMTITDPDVSGAEFVESVRPIRDRVAAAGRRYINLIIDDAEQVRNTTLSSVILDNEELFSFWVSAHPEEMNGIHNPIVTAGRQGRTGFILSGKNTSIGMSTFSSALPGGMHGPAAAGRAAYYLQGNYREVQIPVATTQSHT